MSIVTLLSSLDNTVTTLQLALRVASVIVLVVSVITSFTQQIISDSITAEGKNASRSALVRKICVGWSLIASLAGINNLISTVSHSAVSSASVGNVVIVEGTSIAFLSGNTSIRQNHNIFLNSVTAQAVRHWWQSVQKRLEEGVGSLSSLEEDSENSPLVDTGILCLMEQLNFESKLLVSNVMLAGFVELDPFQGVGDTLIREGTSGGDGEEEFISSVKQDNGGRVVLNVGRVVEVQKSTAGACSWETDGGLQISGSAGVALAVSRSPDV
jgi:hypothetical protein